MYKNQKNFIKEQEKRANNIISTLERNNVTFSKEEGFDSLKAKAYSRAWFFSVLAFFNASVVGYTYFLNEKQKSVRLYSTSYTAEIERLDFLRTKEQVDGTLIEFKLAHRDEVSIFTIDKETIKDFK